MAFRSFKQAIPLTTTLYDEDEKDDDMTWHTIHEAMKEKAKVNIPVAKFSCKPTLRYLTQQRSQVAMLIKLVKMMKK